MRRKKKRSEEKSIVAHKKEELWDQLLTPLEVEGFRISELTPERKEEIREKLKSLYQIDPEEEQPGDEKKEK